MRNLLILSALSISLHSPLLAQKLDKNDDYKAGVSALKDNLAQIAIEKFQSSLKDKSLTEKDRQALLIITAEAHLKLSQSTSALELLANPILKKHQDITFWQAAAYTSAGSFQKAIDLLRLVPKDSSHYDESRISLANLYLALGDNANATPLYKELSSSNTKTAPYTTYAGLRLAEIQISKGLADEALATLTSINTERPSQQKIKALLEAKLDLTNQEYQAASTKLTALIADPQHLSQLSLNNAVITLAEAQRYSGDKPAALDTLFAFLEKNENIAMLHPFFLRIGNWLPEEAKVNDPYLLKLQAWASQKYTEGDEASTNPTLLQQDLSAYAHFTYASYLSKGDDPASLTKALTEFDTLRSNYPQHNAFGRSLMKTAEILLKLDKPEEAVATLETILKPDTNTPLQIKQQAAFLQGQLLAEKIDYAAAAKAFAIASKSQQESLANTAAINTGIAYLANSDIAAFKDHIDSTNLPKVRQQLELEQALWLASKRSISARNPLQTFIQNHPDSSRINEAKLALAIHSIRVLPANPILADQMAQELSVASITNEQSKVLNNIRYLSAMAKEDYSTAIAIAKQDVISAQTNQNTIEIAQSKLLLGQAFYRNGQHNDARRELQEIVTSDPESPFVDYANYYSALAARLEGTPQSHKEAIRFFKLVTDKKSSVTDEASLQLADLYESTNQPELAYELLKKIYKPKATSDLQRNIAVKLAATLQSLGAKDPKYYKESIAVYDRLLTQENLSSLWFNLIHFDKGKTYEKMNLNQEAVNSYYAAINIDHTKKPITEWDWYYSCGFNAIAMLEKLGNPEAAVQVAKKLVNSNGPRAEEAAIRSRDMEMKHMIWDDK